MKKRIELTFKKDKKQSVVLFLLEDEVAMVRPELETLAVHPDLHLTVQPCPFEGIEFLYRVPFDIEGQEISADKSIYWHALTVSKNIQSQEFETFCEAHYAMLVGLLEQDSKKVAQCKENLLRIHTKHLA